MNRMLKISLISVTYNAEKTLPVTLESVLKQDYTNIEHIIIDGASKDDTANLAIEYLQQSDEKDNGHDVKFISERDNGIYDAMNKGLKSATGDYVCFLNAGDSLPDESTLSSMLKEVKYPYPAVIYGHTDIVDADRHFLRKRHLTPPDNLSWQSFKNGMLVCHQAFYVRRDIAQQELYDLHYKYSADFDWCIRVMKRAENQELTFHNSRMVLANYLQEGTTTDNHLVSLKERYKIMQHHYGAATTFIKHLGFIFRNLKVRSINSKMI